MNILNLSTETNRARGRVSKKGASSVIVWYEPTLTDDNVKKIKDAFKDIGIAASVVHGVRPPSAVVIKDL